MSSDKREARGKRETVTLAAPHTHAGIAHAAGDKIRVYPHQRETLAAEGKIRGPRKGGKDSDKGADKS